MHVQRWISAIPSGDRHGIFRHVPLAVAVAYAAAGALWILFSDRAVSLFVNDYAQYQLLQTMKGWLFVGVTAALLFVVLRSANESLLKSHARASESEHQLELALTSAGGGIWDRDLTRERAAYFSPMLKQLIGLAADAPLTLDEWGKRIHPDDDAWVVSSTKAAVASGGKQAHNVRYRVRAEDGKYRWVHSRGKVICNAEGKPVRMVGIVLDVTSQHVAEERITHLTNFDTVSGLANCGTFFRELEGALSKAKEAGEVIAVAQIKIDDFNELFDELAAQDTNKVLQSIGQHLGQLVGPGGLAGRLSQDAFVIASRAMSSTEAVRAAIDNIAAQIDRPIALGRKRVRPSFSIGAALGPQEGGSAHMLVANSNRALTKERPADGSRVNWFTEGMDVESRMRTQRLRDLRVAVRDDRLTCHYQPIVALSSGRAIGFEALARWNRPAEGMVPPDEFIAMAEESGLIYVIGEEVLWLACRAAQRWKHADGIAPFVAVNVSPRQLDDPGFPALIQRVLAGSGLPAERLELEVTENALVRDYDTARDRLMALRNLGITIAIDDFGTGYSSLSSLSRLPFTRLKIDRSFVAEYGVDRQSTAIVNATLHLCDAVRLDVTAEGVETGGQAALLRARGVQAAQGYYFSRPVPADEVGAIINRNWSFEASHPWPAAARRRQSA